MSELITDPEEILAALLADPDFTEAANRDERGVYLMGADGSKRYITQLTMEDGPLPGRDDTPLLPNSNTKGEQK